eukprot:snap_masked-scaffold_68-processed-gene-0.88-mRNA-1 protein AED:0.02 eAED:0.02 QI:0/-1/0/1/-1/1/1/0/319
MYRINALRHIYTQARNFSSAPISKVGVIGMGLMGHGIVQLAAEKFQVVGFDTNKAARESGVKAIEKSLFQVNKKKLSKKVDESKLESETIQAVDKVLGNVSTTGELSDLASCDIIIEAIVENLEIKKNLYSELGNLVGENTILASNTSSFPINELAIASNKPEQVVGLHFFNPVQLMKLVEVIKTDSTSEEVFQKSFKFVEDVKRVPVECKDTPGFIVNRLLVPFLGQALQLLDNGVASKKDIDTAMKLGAGHPMGPIQLADYVGLDTTLSILEGWKTRYPENPAFFIPESLPRLVAEKKLGRKTGEGYYKWEGARISE